MGLLLSLAVVFLSPLASANPDGLERVAENLGFINLGVSIPYELLPDYTIPILGESHLSTILAGVLGSLILASIISLLIRLINRRQARQRRT